MDAFTHTITSEEELRAIIGTPGTRSVLKQRPFLDDHCRAFIALITLRPHGDSQRRWPV